MKNLIAVVTAAALGLCGLAAAAEKTTIKVEKASQASAPAVKTVVKVPVKKAGAPASAAKAATVKK